MAKNEMARTLLEQEPGRVSNLVTADSRNVACRNAKRNNGRRYRVEMLRAEPFYITAAQLTFWALDLLRAAGAIGYSPIHELAPLWSAHVHALRGLGVDIETVREASRGELPGHHAGYLLHCADTAFDGAGAQ